MKFSLLSSALLGVALLPGWVQAQVKFPIFEEEPATIQKVVFLEANQRGDLQHGKMLRMTLNDDKVVKGTLVRLDPKTRKLYLRTEPGKLPIAIADKDIKRIDKGVIKQASFKQDVTVPEIRQVVIFNGRNRFTSYEAPTLSAEELARLNELQAAENELARVDQQADRQNQIIDSEIANQAQHQRTVDIMNDLLWRQPAQYNYTNSTAIGGFPNILYAGNTQRIGYSGTSFFAAGGGALPYAAALAPMSRPGVVIPPSMIVTPEIMTKARQNLMTAQSHAVFENGTLVAVVADDKAH